MDSLFGGVVRKWTYWRWGTCDDCWRCTNICFLRPCSHLTAASGSPSASSWPHRLPSSTPIQTARPESAISMRSLPSTSGLGSSSRLSSRPSPSVRLSLLRHSLSSSISPSCVSPWASSFCFYDGGNGKLHWLYIKSFSEHPRRYMRRLTFPSASAGHINMNITENFRGSSAYGIACRPWSTISAVLHDFLRHCSIDSIPRAIYYWGRWTGR